MDNSRMGCLLKFLWRWNKGKKCSLRRKFGVFSATVILC